MNRFPGAVVLALVAVFVLLGSVQGRQLDRIRDAEAFYRWVQGAAIQFGFEGALIDAQTLAQYGEKPLDNEFFAEVVALAEQTLPALDGHVEGLGPEYARARIVQYASGDEHDHALWAWASGPQTAELRAQFAELNRRELLVSTGSEFSVADMYAQGTAPSLGNVIFGFRELAANLLWLEMDEDFHKGRIHRLTPMMHTITALDPTFTEAYQVGAWHTAYNETARLPDTPEELKTWSDRHGAWVGPKELRYFEGEEFLRRGIRNNPRNSYLYFDLGFAIIMEKQNDPERALPYLEEAVRYKHERYMPRTLARAYGLAGRHETAIQAWRDYQENVDPDSEVAARFIRYEQAMIHESRADELMQELEEIEELLEAEPFGPLNDRLEEIENEIEAARQQAVEIWNGIIAEYGDDGRAYAHVLRNRARELHSVGRTHEAIGMLDHARWNVSSRLFQELSDEMTRIKQESGIRLTLSEMAQLIRNERNEAARAAREQGAATDRAVDLPEVDAAPEPAAS